MSYYAAKTGLDALRLTKAKKDYRCPICQEVIKEGNICYINTYRIPICKQCGDCWEKEGGKLGEISRAK